MSTLIPTRCRIHEKSTVPEYGMISISLGYAKSVEYSHGPDRRHSRPSEGLSHVEQTAVVYMTFEFEGRYRHNRPDNGVFSTYDVSSDDRFRE